MDINDATSPGPGKADALLGAINELSHKLENDSNIHPAFREDIFSILHATVGLCGLLSSASYSKDAVVAQAGSMLQALSTIITHTVTAPSSVGAYLIKKKGSHSDYLLEALMGEAAATDKAAYYTNITGVEWEAVPVILVENRVNRPSVNV